MPTQSIFDTPTANLLPDLTGRRWYANVDNKMEIAPARGKPYHVAVAVPTELFTLFREVLKVPTDQEVTLSLDQVGDRYVFSALAGDNLYDLWDYSLASVPAWIKNPKYRL